MSTVRTGEREYYAMGVVFDHQIEDGTYSIERAKRGNERLLMDEVKKARNREGRHLTSEGRAERDVKGESRTAQDVEKRGRR